MNYLKKLIFKNQLHQAGMAFTSLILIIILASCTSAKKDTIYLESNRNLVGLASFFQMKGETDTLRVEDYFLHPELIDSILFFKSHPLDKNNKLVLNWEGNTPLENLKFFSGDTIFSVLVKKAQKQKYSITYTSTKNSKLVQTKGEFNNWNPTNSHFSKEGNTWKQTLWLAPGQYQYLLVVDGKEILDPTNEKQVSNGMGSFNSLITIKNDTPQPKLSTDKIENNRFTITTNNTNKIIALWQNQAIETHGTSKKPNKIQVTIPTVAKEIKRSFIRIIGANAAKVSNDLLIPLDYGQVLTNPTHITRTDREASILYFMIVDRFEDGNKSNDHPLNIPSVLPRVDFMGGDIAGITKKIEEGYFDSLAISTIWFSPIIQNPEGAYGQYLTPKTKFSAYHGYWPISFNKIDYRFGTPKELHQLVNMAHKHNINVLLDFVANHVHEEHPIYKQHPEWATNLYLPDGSLNTERWDDHRLTTWFDTFLPTLDLTNPKITNILTDSAVFWINEYDLDGFRHDATKHIPEYFWRTLTRKLKKQVVVAHKKQIFQIGETYGSRELTASYINSGELDAQFDFNLYDAALQTFANPSTSFKTLATALNESERYFGSHHLMGNISGNQDKPRFMAMADGSIRFDEDSKFAGWNRKITVKDTTAYQKLTTFMAFNLTIPGIPVIYYGDEIGMTGGNDPDNRRMMRFSNHSANEEKTLTAIKKLAHFRRSNLALIYGDINIIELTDSTLVYSRNYFSTKTYVALNKSNKKVTLKLNGIQLKDINGTYIPSTNNKTEITLSPYGYKICYND